MKLVSKKIGQLLGAAIAASFLAAAVGCGAVAHLAVEQFGGSDHRPAPAVASLPVAQLTGTLARSIFDDPETVVVTYRIVAPGASTVDVGIEVAAVGVDGLPGPFEMAVEASGDPRSRGKSGLPLVGGAGDFAFVWDTAENLDLGTVGRAVVLRITPFVGGVAGSPAQSQPFVCGNAPPAVVLLEAPSARSGNIPFELALVDAESDLSRLEVFFRDRDGTIRPATASVDGLTLGLTTSPAGLPHPYIWSSTTDLPKVTTGSAQLLFRAVDSEVGTFMVVEFPLENNTPPLIAVDQPRGTGLAGAIAVDYVLFDADDDPCDLEVEFSDDSGRTFRRATPAARGTHDGTQALPTSSAAGVRSTFVWDSATDLGPGRVPSVRLRLGARDAFASGNEQVVTFDVDNTPVLEEPVSGLFVTGTVADFDADGQAELLTVSDDGRTISLAPFSREDGSLGTPISSPALAGTNFFRAPAAAIDFDGDRRLDPMVMMNTTTGNIDRIHVYATRNGGRISALTSTLRVFDLGTFGVVHELRGGNFSGAADDTELVVIARQGTGGSAKLRFAGDAIVGVALTQALNPPVVDRSPALAAVGRFNADANDDLLLADGTVLFGNTSSGGTPSQTRKLLTELAGAVASHGIVSDLDGDGAPDAIVLYQGADAVGKALVAFGPFSSGTPPARTVTFDSGLAGLPVGAVGDFDADGFLDLCVVVAALNDRLRASFFLQRGAGTFVRDAIEPEQTGAFTVRGAVNVDLDADGRPEVGVSTTQGIVVFRRGDPRVGRSGLTGAGGLTAAPIGPAGAAGLFAHLTSGATVSLGLYRPARSFTEPVGGAAGLPTLEASRTCTFDVTGDGFRDVLLHDADGRLEVAEQALGHRIESPYGSSTTEQPGATPADLTAAALTSSGRDDVYTATTDGIGSAFAVTLQSAAGVVDDTSTIVPLEAERIIAADLDEVPGADGARHEDILAIATALIAPRASLIRGPREPEALATVETISLPIGQGPLSALAVARRASGGSAVFLSGAGSTPTAILMVGEGPMTVAGSPAAFRRLATGDVNGDGFDDVVGTVAGGGFTVFSGSAAGTFTMRSYPSGGAGFDPTTLAVGDLDGDGRDDVFAASSAVPDAIIHYQSAAGTLDSTFATAIVVSYQAPPTPVADPIVADVDGDGAADLVGVSRRIGSAQTAAAVLLRRADGLQDRTVVGLPGVSVEDLAVGDLNGDGVPDLAMLRGSPVVLDVRLRRAPAPGTSGELGGVIRHPRLGAIQADVADVVRSVAVAMGPFDPERVEFRSRPAAGVRRLRTGKLRLPVGSSICGPAVLATPEVLPLEPGETVELVLPVVPGLNLEAPGRKFFVFRLDRDTGQVTSVGEARTRAPASGSLSREVAIDTARLGIFAVGVDGNAAPSAIVQDANVPSGKKYVEIIYDVSDADGDMVRVVAEYATDGTTGRTWRPCSLFDGREAEIVAPGTGRLIEWDALRDLGRFNGQVLVRVVPRDLSFGAATPRQESINVSD